METNINTITPEAIVEGNRKLALFEGAKLNPKYPTIIYHSRVRRIDELKYHSDFNWFVPVWNRAVTELKEWDMTNTTRFDNQARFEAISIYSKLHLISKWTFTIETRYPILIEIIDFLNSQPNPGESQTKNEEIR